MDRQRVLADLPRKTADAIDQGTCILTNAQASMIIDELTNRPMSKEQASVFWAVLAITVITGVEPLLCVFVAIVLAYASEWASLCLFAANKLYDTLWQRIKNKRHRHRR